MARSLPAPAWALAGIVLGFVVGGIGPRGELSALQDDVSRLQDELVKARRQAARRSPLSVIGLDRAGAPDDGQPAPREETDAASSGLPDGPATGGRDTATPPPLVVEGEPGATPDPMAEYELAVQAQRVRIEQSRAALIEQADLDEGQVADLDAAMGRMNDQLAAMGEDLLGLIESGTEPDSKELLGVTHDVTGILYEAQVEMDEIIGAEAVPEVDPQSREVWNYVDLESFRDTVQAAGGVTGVR